MGRIRRWVFRGGIACLILAFLGLAGVAFYLRSDHARELATQQLSEIVGGSVSVQRIAAGIGSTTVAIVVPSDPADSELSSESTPPIFTGTVRVNANLLDLALGHMPAQISVEEARLHLRFDQTGRLLTQFPTPPSGAGSTTIPTITVRNATLTIDQMGHPPFIVDSVALTVAPNENGVAISGATTTARWGQWTISGQWTPDFESGTVSFATVEPLAATTSTLATVPFIPPETWEEIHVDGHATARLTLTRQSGELGYSVDVRPIATRMEIPAIELILDDAAGVITIDESHVHLSDFTGTTAQGHVSANGTLHFAASPPELTLQARAKGLVVSKLPAAWGLPPNLEGQLNGSANLTLILASDGLQTRGSGRGRMTNARWGGIPIERLDMKLVSGEKGYQFQAEQPMSLRPLGPHWWPTVILGILLQPPTASPPAATSTPAPPPTYFEANLRLRDVDLEELITKLEVDLPIRVAGKISVTVKAGIPLNQARTLRAYRLDGTITLPELRLHDLIIHNVQAHFRFREGVLTLDKLSGSVPAARNGSDSGTFHGTARLGVDPRTELTASLDVTRLPLEAIARIFPDLGSMIAGRATGSLTLRVPANKLGDVSALVIEARVQAEKLTLRERPIAGLSCKIAVQDGTVRLQEAAATVAGLPVSGTASCGLRAPYPFHATMRTSATEPITLTALIPERDWPFPLSGTLVTHTHTDGTLVPFTLTASGSAVSEKLTLGAAVMHKLSLDWSATGESLQITNLTATAFAGTLTGSATVPFLQQKAGTFRMDLRDVDAALLTRAVPRSPVKLQGTLSGTVTGTLPPVEKGTRAITVTLDMSAPKLRVQGFPAERLHGQIGYKPGAITYSLTGSILGGGFDVNGTYPLVESKPLVPASDTDSHRSDRNGGVVQFTNLDLGHLGTALRLPTLEPLSGKLNLTLPFTIDSVTGRPTGSGHLVIEGFSWGHQNDSRLTAVVRVTPEMIQCTELTGRFADGELRGRARYNLANPRRSYFLLTLDHANADNLLRPEGITGVSGRVSAHLRGQLSGAFHGSGTITGNRVTAYGLQLGEVRLPLTWAFMPHHGGELDIHDAFAAVVGGRVTGQTQISWNESLNVQGRLKLIDLDMVSLLGNVGRGNRANGQIRFTGRNMRSISDLTGSVTMKFRGSGSLLDHPVVRALSPFLNGMSAFTQSRSGDLRAHLAKGIIRVQQFTMTTLAASLFAEGTVGALNGRLDLTITVQTGNAGPSPALMQLLRFVPVAGPIPLGVLIEINRALSNRVIRLSVGGTLQHPTVRLHAAQMVTENALRFLLGSFLPLPENVD